MIGVVRPGPRALSTLEDLVQSALDLRPLRASPRGLAAIDLNIGSRTSRPCPLYIRNAVPEMCSVVGQPARISLKNRPWKMRKGPDQCWLNCGSLQAVIARATSQPEPEGRAQSHNAGSSFPLFCLNCNSQCTCGGMTTAGTASIPTLKFVVVIADLLAIC